MASSAVSVKTPVKSPARRVLGNLTPRAINTPPRPSAFVPTEDVKNRSPLKQVQTLSQLADAENQPPAGMFTAGRKRSIYEVEDAENLEYARRGCIGHDRSPHKAPTPITAAALREHTGTTDHDLVDEEDLPPTEPDTPEPERVERAVEQVSQDTNASSQSFSAWVDYYPNGHSSQNVEEPEPEKTVKIHAETLRLRLQLALYKVRTNQTQKRLAEVELPTPRATPSLRASISTAPTAPTSSEPQSQSLPSITVSPARHDSVTLHVTANLDPSSHFPKLHTAPVLLPTAYSSRMISDYRVPSSPPAPSPVASIPDQTTSPSRHERSGYTTPVPRQRRLEDGEDECDRELQRLMDRRLDEDLTSSAVKGRAASGLLDLMKGQR